MGEDTKKYLKRDRASGLSVIKMTILYLEKEIRNDGTDYTYRLPEAALHLSYRQPILLLGSCFADAVGERMKQQRFPSMSTVRRLQSGVCGS